MIETLKRHWWVPVIRGIAAIVFGIIAFTHPVMAIATLVLFFGAWVLIDGIFRIFGAIKHRGSDPDWAWQLVIGLIGIIVGLLTFHAPQVTALALVIYIAAWALMIGASEIVMAVKLRHEIKGRMVADSDGARINRFRRVAPVESCRWRRRSDLAHRMVRSLSSASLQSFLVSV